LEELLDEIELRFRQIVGEEFRAALREQKEPLLVIGLQESSRIVEKETTLGFRSLLTANQVAETLGVSVHRVYELVRTRKTSGFPVIRLGERSDRFTRKSILAWLERDDTFSWLHSLQFT
jgi:predicted DNA-binding transcriptional regulator AlpA